MSAVELPHVPSARAPSSAASSSRRSLHSAGSTASYTSAKSLQRSYGGGEEDDDEEEDEEEEEEEEEEPHESSSGSGGLWDEVESFLNKPSPSFVALAKEGSKTVGSSSGVRSVLPTLTSGERKQPVAPPVSGGNQSGPRSTRAVRMHSKQPTASVGGKAIDPKLLQEAFAYAEKIQKVSLDDDEEDETDQQREADKRSGGGVGMLRRDSSFGATGSGSGGPRMPSELKKQGAGGSRGKPEEKAVKKKAKPGVVKSSAYGVSVKPQPTKKKSSSGERRPGKDSSSEWDASPVSSADPNGDGPMQSRKGSSSSASMLDQQTVQSLVSNLQNGTALEELRRELQASQQSMAMSRQVIQDAAKSFFHTRK